MKNIYFCALVLGACSAAKAQSTVSIYGAIDAGIRHTTGSGNKSLSELSTSGMAGSRIGFRIHEDLGNGMYAGAGLEGSLNIDTGTGRPSNTNNQPSGATAASGLTFDRFSYVKLGDRQWGELRLGRDFSPNHRNATDFDVFNGVGIAKAGNFIYTTVGSASMPTTISVSNTVSYWLPQTLGGFHGFVMAGSGENANDGPKKNDGNYLGTRFGYKSGRFDSAIALAKTKYDPTNTIGDYRHMSIAASWDASFAQFYLIHNIVKVKLAAGNVDKQTTTISSNIPVFGTDRIRLSISHLNDKSNSLGTASNDANQFAIGYVRNLSKRTAIYGTWAKISNHGSAQYAVTGSPTPAPGRASSGFEIGIRHFY